MFPLFITTDKMKLSLAYQKHVLCTHNLNEAKIESSLQLKIVNNLMGNSIFKKSFKRVEL